MGTVQKRGKSYKLRVYAGKDINGKQIEHSMTWTPPADMSAKTADKEAHKQLILFEERIKNGATANGRMKFVDFADLWFETYANPQLRPKTVSRYRILMTRINLAIGHLRLEAIQPMMLLTFYNRFQDLLTKYQSGINRLPDEFTPLYRRLAFIYLTNYQASPEKRLKTAYAYLEIAAARPDTAQSEVEKVVANAYLEIEVYCREYVWPTGSLKKPTAAETGGLIRRAKTVLETLQHEPDVYRKNNIPHLPHASGGEPSTKFSGSMLFPSTPRKWG